MTFTYTPSAPDDLTYVRYYTGDTDSATAMWTDEEINMVLALEASVGGAVISLIKSAIARLALEPDMTADWLRVDWRRSTDSWKTLLGEMKEKFGQGWSLTSSALDTYRPDTFLTEVPDYNDPYSSEE